jgi:putative addiction module component (TIGR02574 family)
VPPECRPIEIERRIANWRAELARELIASLDGPADADADQAWGEEIERRIANWRADRTKGVPWPEAEARILARLERVRAAR